MNISLVLLSAGSSSRFGSKTKKHWLRIADEPLWLFVANRFKSMHTFEKIIITASEDEYRYMQGFVDDEVICIGGDTRAGSLRNALQHVDTEFVLVSDVARVCFDRASFERLMQFDRDGYGCVTTYLKAVDTVVHGDTLINRDELKLIQTPQLSQTTLLKKALSQSLNFTDDSSAIASLGAKVGYVLGDANALKLTYLGDIQKLSCLTPPVKTQFVGSGFDVHGFEEGKPMVLGGVKIDSTFGFKAHSDGDVLLHSLVDAILGAIGAGDIGEWFPDNNQTYKNIDSAVLVQKVVDFALAVGYEIVNVDVTVMAQTPRLGDYKSSIRARVASLLGIDKSKVNIKATTTENLGFVGRKEGVAVQSIANMRYFNWEMDR